MRKDFLGKATLILVMGQKGFTGHLFAKIETRNRVSVAENVGPVLIFHLSFCAPRREPCLNGK
jgi:hypothetical protein